MESQTPHLTPFDTIISDGFLQTIKILIPYFPPRMQYMIGLYVKVSELSYIMSGQYLAMQKSMDAKSLLSEIEPYLPYESRKMFSEFQEFFDMFEMMQELDLSNIDFSNIFQSERSSSYE